jgi:SAM-dependent methyltransferase
MRRDKKNSGGAAGGFCPACGFLIGGQHSLQQVTLCPNCGHRTSCFQPVLDGNVMDVSMVCNFHRSSLRMKNFEIILDSLQNRMGNLWGKTLLDVGCSVGAFAEAASRRGIRAYGIEPEEDLKKIAEVHSEKVYLGYFPDALPKELKFDLISFNDVLEHIEDVNSSIEECRRRLNPGGILVINLPSSRGIFYQVASAMDKLGARGPLSRLWQVGSRTPHLHYFSPDTLKSVCERHHLLEVERNRLPSVTLDGLWSRLRAEEKRRRVILVDLLLFLALSISIPFLGLLPSDISVSYFSKTRKNGGSGNENSR